MDRKEDLLKTLNICHNNFQLISLGILLIASEECSDVIMNAQVYHGRFNVKFDQVLKQDKEKLGDSLYEITKVAYRSLIAESYQNISSYCRDTKQDEKIKSATWFNFGRIIRNAFNHDFRLDLKKEKDILPIAWFNKSNPAKKIEINSNMDKWFVDIVNKLSQKDRDMLQFTYEDALDLYDDMVAFVAEIY